MRRLTSLCVVALVLATLAAPLLAQPNTGDPQYLWWGLATEPERDKGLLVIGITPGSPAEKAGLAVGDVITKINTTDVKTEARGPNAHLHHMQADRPGVNFTLYFMRGDRERNVTITCEIMAREYAQTVTWMNTEFSPLFQQFIDAMNDGNQARMAEIREQLTPVVRAKARQAQGAVRTPDEMIWNWLPMLGFLGDRRGVERAFNDVMNPRLRRGEVAPQRIYTKVRLAWALIALADPDTDVDVVKSLATNTDHPIMSRYGAQLIVTMFEVLAAEGSRSARKIEKLQKDLAKAGVIEPLGNIFINEIEDLKRYSQFLGQWRQQGSPDPSRLEPNSANAVYQSQSEIARARAHARAIGWIPERLSISYLARARDVEDLREVASQGLERLIPGHSQISFEWYRDNVRYLYFDDAARVWKFSEEAKAAGKSAEEWLKENK